MKKRDKEIIYVFLRYFAILIIGLFAFSYFYTIFTPLTIHPVNSLLSIFYGSLVYRNIIIVNDIPIELIGACIAGSAYYLLLLLNLSVPMPVKKRFLSIIFSFALFLIINILRIFIFSLLYINNFKYFNLTHLLFWYIISGIIVFLIWLTTIKTFTIKNIPFYTDLKLIYSQINYKRRKIKK